MMAISILDKLADPAATKTLLAILLQDDAELAPAARRVLRRLPAGEADAAIAELLGDANADARCLAIDLVTQRRMDGMVPTLFQAAADDAEPVRLAAFKALEALAGIDRLEDLLDLLVKGQSPDEIEAAKRAVTGICLRNARIETGNIEIVKALYGDLPLGKSADVTPKVTEMVQSGNLEVEASNNHFGDPAAGKVKRLRLDYKVGGRVNSKTVKEGETITIAARQVSPACTEAILAALPKAPLEPKKALLRILTTFGGPAALQAIRAATADANPEIRESAWRALFEWPDTDALPDLAELAGNATPSTFRILALRGYIRLIQQQDAPAGEKVALLKNAVSLAQRDEEMKSILAVLGTVPTLEALALVTPHLENPVLKDEAATAVVAITGEMSPPRPAAAREALSAAARATANPQITQRAKDLLGN